MSRSSRKKPENFAKQMAKGAKEAILDLHVKQLIVVRQNNNGSLPNGFIDEVVASLTSQGIEATRHTIYNHEKKLRRKSIPSEQPAPSTVRLQVRLANPNNTPAKVTSPSATTNQGGRPRGSTISAKFNLEKATNDGLEFAASKILRARAQARKTTLSTGIISSIINEANTLHNLKEHAMLKRSTVLSRVHRGNPKGWAGHPKTSTPMKLVEPILVALCLKLVRSGHGQPLDCTEFLAMASSLVKDTPTEKAILEHRRLSKKSSRAPLLG
ncbi:hypothetical protein IV203_015650 [Nitzschia inconspicua]|uniref:Uncharacterized protein n=1 Tax=Nitzschia inconspicua TaxID=303405 RepID=A0A9K3LD40_9STRA|nr:hypothetical protein IV203_015650 [Nitzschia inconspicua]